MATITYRDQHQIVTGVHNGIAPRSSLTTFVYHEFRIWLMAQFSFCAGGELFKDIIKLAIMNQLPKHSGDPLKQDPAIFMQHFRSGDLRALKLVFYQFYAALSYFANRLTESPAAADQIVEDSFAALWDERTSFQDVAAIKTFLYLHIQDGCFQFIKTWQTVISQDADWDQIRAISEKYVPNEIVRTEVFKSIHEAPDILTQLSKKITATHHAISKNFRNRVLQPVRARLAGLRMSSQEAPI